MEGKKKPIMFLNIKKQLLNILFNLCLWKKKMQRKPLRISACYTVTATDKNALIV